MADSTFVRLPRLARSDDSLLPPETAIQFSGDFVLTDAPDKVLGGGATKGATVVTVSGGATVTPAAVVAAIDGQDVSLGEVNAQQVTVASNVTVNGALSVAGAIFQGPAWTDSSAATTTGGGSDTLIVLPLADNSAATVRLTIIARCAALPASYSQENVSRLEVESGSLTSGGGDLFVDQTFGLPPSIGDGGWSAGAYTIDAVGPLVHIVGTADHAGTATDITVSETVTAHLTGRSVTIAGATGTPGLNGAHVATYVSGQVFRVSVVYVANDAAATAVLTTPPVVAWSVVATMVVTPVP